jgi:acetyl-CoA acyltransferase
VDPALVDDVIWGCGAQVGDQSFNIARNAVLAAGWPDGVPGTTIDRQCGSSQQSVHFAAAGLVSGQYEVVVAGGMESMSRVPMGKSLADGDPLGPMLMERYEGRPPNQGIGAEMMAARWGFSREDLDAFALESHARAAAAIDAGRFEAQIAPVRTAEGVVSVDEGVRRGGTLETLGQIKPAYTPDGKVTAGNASQISDGGGALLMMTGAKAAELGLTPIARIHTAVLAAEDPVIMLTAPIPATKKALDRAGLSIDDIGVFEINEAFASVVLAWAAELDANMERVNPNGGAIAVGHPLGASGAILVTKTLHELERTGGRYGLISMCCGGGLGTGTLIERV